MTELVGRSGARYRLDDAPPATGGQALVYRAVALDDERVVAVKVSQMPEGAGAGLAEEVRRLQEIGRHPEVGPHVAPVWDEGRWDDRPFAVLDWYGDTLATWCPTRSLSERLRAARALVTVVEALDRAGVVHGDLKPENVLLRDGDPRAVALTDFGALGPGPRLFTPGYAPPEQIAGDAPDPAWDRYALAATLWRCLVLTPALGPRLGSGPLAEDRRAFDAALPGRVALRRALEARLRSDARHRPRDVRGLLAALDLPPAPTRRPVRAVVGGVAAAFPLALAFGALHPSASCPAGWSDEGAACVAEDGRAVVRIAGGHFQAGRLDDQRPQWTSDAPPHSVALSGSLWVSTGEVTQREWAAVMGTDPVATREQTFESGVVAPCATWLGRSLVDPEMPVVCVSWHDAVAYANARSALDGLEPAYVEEREADSAPRVLWDRRADGWRLPTEAEWEWFARAGTSSPWVVAPSRDELCDWGNVRDEGALEKFGNEIACDDGEPVLARVRTFQPNPWGLHDTIGNALEWVWDPYGPYPEGLAVDPAGPAAGASRTLRGASWHHVARGVDARYAARPEDLGHSIGFRLVRDAQ